MKSLSIEVLKQYRDKTFRYPPSLWLRSPQQAIQFVEERGFIHFWPSKGVCLPSLWCAVAGDRPVPDEHDDPGQVSWSWKDQLLDKRVWYYARVVKKRNTMISMKTIPFFYALSPNYGDPETEIEDQYHQGLLPLEVKLVFKALLEKGPLDSLSLRREAHLSGHGSASPFNRALDILQRDLRVLPVSIADVGTWHYAFVYDLTHRYYPNLLEESRFINEHQARRHLLSLYLKSVGAISEKEIRSLFGWSTEQTEKTVCKLVEEGLLVNQVELEKADDPLICLSELVK